MKSSALIINLFATVVVGGLIVALLLGVVGNDKEATGGDDPPVPPTPDPPTPDPPVPPVPPTPVPTTYIIDGNGELSIDGEAQLEIDATEPISDEILAKFSYDTKGAQYFTKYPDGSGDIYENGETVPAGTTIYCKWTLKLHLEDDDIMENLKIIHEDDPESHRYPIIDGMYINGSFTITGTIPSKYMSVTLEGNTIKARETSTVGTDIIIGHADITSCEFDSGTHTLTFTVSNISEGIGITFSHSK